MSQNNLKQKALSLGISQAQIAESVGCSQGQISKVFSGHIPPSSRTFKRISNFLEGQINDPDLEGRAILNRLIEECWNGTTEHALAINELVRAGLKLSQSKVTETDGR